MHPLLRELHQDHINLARVLQVLERQLGLLRNGDDADLYVLSEVIDYVRSYPDVIHHPREDVIFSVYLERSGRGVDVVERLVVEHRLLIEQTLELREHVDQWMQDLPLPRDRIAGRITDYLRMQWDHLNLEEDSVYALLASELTSDDWERIEAAMPSGADPLFGQLLRQRYENIYDQVFASA